MLILHVPIVTYFRGWFIVNYSSQMFERRNLKIRTAQSTANCSFRYTDMQTARPQNSAVRNSFHSLSHNTLKLALDEQFTMNQAKVIVKIIGKVIVKRRKMNRRNLIGHIWNEKRSLPQGAQLLLKTCIEQVKLKITALSSL